MVESLKAILRDVLGDLEKKQNNTHLDKAQKTWERLVGAQAAAHTRIIHLTKEKIHVNVDSSARLYTLNLKKAELRAALKKALGTDELKLTLGQVTAR
jgi:predicted nucleic acid-binding Zn ribbon protein